MIIKNNITKIFYGLCVVFVMSCSSTSNVLEISSEYPQRNEQVTITYNPEAPGAKIPDTATQVNLKFTYGNLYALPYELPLEKKGNVWQKTIDLPHYATFATFVFKSGDITDQPAPDKHYELYIYDGKKPVKSTYLYRGYSLSAQMPKSDSLAYQQSLQYKKELELYPDNYEAKIRLLKYRIDHGTPKESKKAKAEAMQVIDAKFHADPTFGGNVNKVTMGYLILGEKSRVDSVRQVVIDQFPNSALAKEYLASQIADEADPAKQLARLEAALRDKTEKNESGYSSIYSMLFDRYTEVEDSAKSKFYADLVVQDTSPYRVRTLQEVAQQLVDHNLNLEQALGYVQQAIADVEEYPLGLIRYFPETGYILSHVADKEKQIESAKGDLKALEGKILYQIGRKQEAAAAMDEAWQLATKKETLLRIGDYYAQVGSFGKAFEVYTKVYLQSPMDAEVAGKLEEAYKQENGSATGYTAALAKLDQVWKGKMKRALQDEMIDKPLPELKQVTDLAGKPLSMESLQGKILVIDFWATWCIPCLKSFPYMQKVYDRYKDDKRVQFIILNTGSNNTLEEAQQWKKSNASYTFPIYHNTDPNMVSDFGVNLIPASFVVDTDQRIRFQTVGFEGEILEPKLDLMLQILLEGK